MRRIGAALLVMIAGTATGETITGARFSEPTSRYAHGVLGDATEWGALLIDTDNTESQSVSGAAAFRKTTYRIRLPLNHVFEDIAPRLVDVTGDRSPEVVVVETDVNKGASLAIYTQRGKLAETPHIGTRNRWLAPVGAADIDGDGHVEIAYIDRPHLAKTLRIWRYKNRKLTEVVSHPGLTNHKIGWEFIAGGIRTCGGRPEIITASADWSRIMATAFDGKVVTSNAISPYTGPKSLSAALSCD